MYDIIGDVHGHADQLEALLKKLGYNCKNGAYSHSERKLISVGDLCDRGPAQRRTIDIIRAMHEADQAYVIMGNHEFNAVAWATPNGQGGYLRKHDGKNFDQHKAFLLEAEQDHGWYASTIEWFKQLPIYLDLPELRTVHACWHEPSKAVLDRYTDANGILLPEAWLPANTKGHELHTAIEVLSKGWELDLPEGYQFLDKGNHPRTAIRTEWWRTDTTRYRDLAIGVDNLNELPEGNIPSADLPGYDGEKPLFVGHYWMKGEPSLQSPHIACVDWSVAANGLMAAYRFDGERELRDSGFVWV